MGCMDVIKDSTAHGLKIIGILSELVSPVPLATFVKEEKGNIQALIQLRGPSLAIMAHIRTSCRLHLAFHALL